MTENFKMWTYTGNFTLRTSIINLIGTVAFLAPEVFNETEYT